VPGIGVDGRPLKDDASPISKECHGVTSGTSQFTKQVSASCISQCCRSSSIIGNTPVTGESHEKGATSGTVPWALGIAMWMFLTDASRREAERLITPTKPVNMVSKREREHS
jgi:hypothetical protein